jgi:signal transduction histidine kinase
VREPIEIADVAEEAWDSLREGTRAQTIVFELDVAPDAATVYADADAVRQVLTNLFDNSIRYTPAGGRIVCRSAIDGNGVAISVADTGSGIVREHLPRVFERFYRADPSRSREEGGTGLGLAIVKHLVEAHGGRVLADSERGVGTTMTCWFPDAAVTHQPT